jgi:hypothetical protein
MTRLRRLLLFTISLPIGDRNRPRPLCCVIIPAVHYFHNSERFHE